MRTEAEGRGTPYFLVDQGINSYAAAPGKEVDRWNTIIIINKLYQRIDGILLASSKYGKRQLVMKN